MVFIPHSKLFGASHKICLCENCRICYGSCPIFPDYGLAVPQTNKIVCRYSTSSKVDGTDKLTEDENTVDEYDEFIFSGPIVADSASEMSSDAETAIWFIKVVDNKISNDIVVDDYGNSIPPNTLYSVGNFPEHVFLNKSNQVFKISKKIEEVLLIQMFPC